jgi:hypothetical protein
MLVDRPLYIIAYSCDFDNAFLYGRAMRVRWKTSQCSGEQYVYIRIQTAFQGQDLCYQMLHPWRGVLKSSLQYQSNIGNMAEFDSGISIRRRLFMNSHLMWGVRHNHDSEGS